MIREQYLSLPEVTSFTEWLAHRLQSIPVGLTIRSSKFVPGGLRESVRGINAVIDRYQWGADWGATKMRLNILSSRLQTAVRAADDAAVFSVCDDILDWGGDRNPKVGARPFLARRAGAGELADYLRLCEKHFALDSADLALFEPHVAQSNPVERMNSMMTKIHALLSEDGLPIYDSRVAAAIAALVAMFQQEHAVGWTQVPESLLFPAVSRLRTAQHFKLNALDHGVLLYEPSPQIGASISTLRWSSAKIRLGWILAEVLRTSPELAANEPDARSRMHAMEAGLFMIGYDVAGLTTPDTATAEAPAVRLRQSRIKPQSRGETVEWRICCTLGRPAPVRYAMRHGGFALEYGQTQLTFAAEDVDDMLREFAGLSNVPLGANRTPAVPDPDAFGQWLTARSTAYGLRLTPQHASQVAAVLVAEFGVKSRKEGNRVLLNFPY